MSTEEAQKRSQRYKIAMTTAFDCIETGIEGDEEKCRAYAELLLQKLQQDGEERMAEHLQRILEGRKGAILHPAEGDMNSMLAVQDRMSDLHRALNSLEHEVEMAMNRYDASLQCYSNMDKQERLATCKELELLVCGKPANGRNSAQQLYNTLMQNKARELNLAGLLQQKKVLQEELRKAQLSWRAAEAQAELARKG